MSSKKSQTGFTMEKLREVAKELDDSVKCDWCDETLVYIVSKGGKPIGGACEEHLPNLYPVK